MLYTSRTTGEQVDITIRPFAPKDAPHIIQCLKDAYGDTYVKPEFYTPEGICHAQETGHVAFYVGELADGTIVGITANEREEDFPGQVEYSCHVVLNEYAGYGLSAPLARYQKEEAQKAPPTSYFARMLGAHKLAQRSARQIGLTPCGFFMQVFDAEKFKQLNFKNNFNKISQSIATTMGTKRDAGILHLPEEIAPLATMVYEQLGMDWHTGPIDAPQGAGQHRKRWDDRHQSGTLWVDSVGFDTTGWILEETKAMAEHHPLATVDVILNLCDPASTGVYHWARRQGFFFTGFFPCAQLGEYVVLHHSLKVPDRVDDIPCIPEYMPFVEEIRRQQYGN